jgi:RNA 3'-terminal phosphate cyclase (ATP)
MVEIDGSYGEGGGQILRSALSISALLGVPVRVYNIRAGRRNPGLQAQHIAGVRALAKICSAHVEGDRLSSTELFFKPGPISVSGTMAINVAEERGSAGSISLVLQALLLPLSLVGTRSRLFLEGGTHVSWSPPIDYVSRVLFRTLGRIGVKASLRTKRWGWYPIGGGQVEVEIEGAKELSPLMIPDRGALKGIRGVSIYSNLPKHVGERQRGRAIELLSSSGLERHVYGIELLDAPSPGKGSCLFLEAEFENSIAGFSALGERGKPAEKVAEEAVSSLLSFLRSDGSVDEHLADQLIPFLALSSGKSVYKTQRISGHLLTNIWVIKKFIDVKINVSEEGVVEIEGIGYKGRDGR